jgi:hypothetical protein
MNKQIEMANNLYTGSRYKNRVLPTNLVSEEDKLKRREQSEKEKISLEALLQKRTRRTMGPIIEVMGLNCKEKETF